MRRLTISVLLLSIVGACASPNPALYTLAVLPGVTIPATRHSIELRRIGLAAYLDRPGILRTVSPYRLDTVENARWAAPRGSMLEQVIIQDLAERLPDAQILSETGNIAARADIILEIDMQRMDADAAGEVVLLAQVAARRDRGHAEAKIFRIHTPAAGPGTEDLVAAMSHAVAAFADELAPMLAADNTR